jgi:hypothetical protein
MYSAVTARFALSALVRRIPLRFMAPAAGVVARPGLGLTTGAERLFSMSALVQAAAKKPTKVEIPVRECQFFINH